MKSKMYISEVTRKLYLLAALAAVVNVSTALAQTPASPANKASNPPPMSAQPMPMEKGTTMNAMPGMAQGGGDMRGSMAGMMKSMDSMKSTGNTDKDFAMMMKMHHQGAIDMATMELQTGKDSKMRAMAKRIIEAQQKAMDEDPDFKLLAVVADAPLTHFRRVMDQLIAKEQALKITVQAAAPVSVPAGD